MSIVEEIARVRAFELEPQLAQLWYTIDQPKNNIDRIGAELANGFLNANAFVMMRERQIHLFQYPLDLGIDFEPSLAEGSEVRIFAPLLSRCERFWRPCAMTPVGRNLSLMLIGGSLFALTGLGMMIRNLEYPDDYSDRFKEASNTCLSVGSVVNILASLGWLLNVRYFRSIRERTERQQQEVRRIAPDDNRIQIIIRRV